MLEIRFDVWNFKKLSFVFNEMYLFVLLFYVFGGKWNWLRLFILNCGWYVVRFVIDSVVKFIVKKILCLNYVNFFL